MGSRAAFYVPSETTRLEPLTKSFVYAGMAVAHFKTGRLATVMYVPVGVEQLGWMIVDVAPTDDDVGGEQRRWVTAFNSIVPCGRTYTYASAPCTQLGPPEPAWAL